MLKRLHLRNFTVFADAEFKFGEGINVLVGANGTGKSHVLKAGYAVESAYSAISFGEQNATVDGYDPSFSFNVSSRLADVFLPKGLRNLVRRVDLAIEHWPTESEIHAAFGEKGEGNFGFTISPISSTKSTSRLNKMPVIGARHERPVFIPAKEMLSLMPDIVGLSDKYSDLLDSTYTGLARLLLTPPLKRVPIFAEDILGSILKIIKGNIKSENGSFFLSPKNGSRFEIKLIAEGHRKIGTLAYLIANGTLTPETTLFWDEPEANLNPALLKDMAAVLTDLAQAGFQIILATHSLFLMRELHILAQRKKKPVRYFGLYAGEDGAVQVERQDDLMQLQHLVALDAELAQTFDFEATLDDEYAGDS